MFSTFRGVEIDVYHDNKFQNFHSGYQVANIRVGRINILSKIKQEERKWDRQRGQRLSPWYKSKSRGGQVGKEGCFTGSSGNGGKGGNGDGWVGLSYVDGGLADGGCEQGLGM